MKLSYSIENWKNMSWDEYTEVAEATRMAGIDLYDVAGAAFRGKSSPTNPELAASSRRSLMNRDLSVSCVGLVSDLMDDAVMAEAAEAAEAANNLGAACLIVRAATEDTEAHAERIRDLMALIAEKPVTLLVETAGPYADTATC